MSAPTRDALQSAVAVLMREAEQRNGEARATRKLLAKRNVLEPYATQWREQAAEDEAESCRLASVAGWLQAEANRSGAASAAVTHGNADAP